MARPLSFPAPFAGDAAPYATRPTQTRGRLYPEPESLTRTVFQRDRDRIIHSAAFRRLKHKTQVFVYHEGDYYRTRLTHSLEVAQIARSIARILGLDEDLAEALALAHDLGHTPFGHAGEDALNAAMAPFGGFDHNAQALKLVTALEHRYAAFDGLNLTWECLEGMVKHNGPLLGPHARGGEVPAAILSYARAHDLELDRFAGLEAQVAAISDDIAYNNHDIDDGLRAQLFPLDALMAVPLVGPVFQELLDRYPGLERQRLIHEAVRRLMTLMIEDVVRETLRRIEQDHVRSVEEVRLASHPFCAFSADMAAYDAGLKEFLFANMYRHYRVNRSVAKAKRVVRELFDLFLNQPNVLPPEWARGCERPGSAETARVVCDYIAGMTDRYALEEHRRLFAIEGGY
ncbi:MAG: deoxyguanosinetriphosphate triphosphohydrolase [Alphaproteobacteria bacterium]|nr:deoxyguanosinetriphosphate triphosphohydrolase [Alphaproteobacteria bacterium]